ncbi:MAG: hypothetical protein ACI4F4_04180 [Lachnospiraceae bacterium]
MDFLTKLERKFGKFSIPNLTLFLIVGFVLGFFIEVFQPDAIAFISLNPEMILKGQIWRLFTWVLMPPNGVNLLIILTLMFYWFVGRTLENIWGEFRYNLYIFSGIIFTDIGMIATYVVLQLMGQTQLAAFFSYTGIGVSSYYLCLSMFLAYATLFPEQQLVTLFFFIPVPVKVKWLGYLDIALLIVDICKYLSMHYIPGVVSIITSILNFILFYFLLKGKVKVPLKQKKKSRTYKKEVRQTQILTRHKCAICGQTEEDDPSLEFRYCSRCKGNYEYCNNHLFSHEHKK